MALTYRQAGVDIDAGEALVERIKPLAKSTRIAELVEGVGGFAGMCALPAGIEQPLLVSGTDGVGTKLKVAFAMGRHDTIGIDLVAMCANDVITTGARPLFFLDYFATSKLDVDQAEQVVSGNRCRLSARRLCSDRRRDCGAPRDVRGGRIRSCWVLRGSRGAEERAGSQSGTGRRSRDRRRVERASLEWLLPGSPGHRQAGTRLRGDASRARTEHW